MYTEMAKILDDMIGLVCFGSSRQGRKQRHGTKLKWIKLLQTSFPLGFNGNIYHEGNISKMPDFDVFSLVEIRKRKSRSHGIRKKEMANEKSAQ